MSTRTTEQERQIRHCYFIYFTVILWFLLLVTWFISAYRKGELNWTLTIIWLAGFVS